MQNDVRNYIPAVIFLQRNYFQESSFKQCVCDDKRKRRRSVVQLISKEVLNKLNSMTSFVLFVIVCCVLSVFGARLSEQERVAQWRADPRNTWPPTWQNETEAFKNAMAFRESELMMLPGSRERWENFMQYTSSRMVPRFTPNGFKLIQTPASVQKRLKERLDKALEDYDSIRKEEIIDVLYTPEQSRFVDLHGLDWEILREIRPMFEEWSGLELIPTSIYGIRLNSNGSSLVMHYDKQTTHVISAIVHVGHEYDDDDKPWPIEIEDHNGDLHAVNLEAGQMLFYESAACLHGRRQKFAGKYYASIFMHYKPKDKNIWNFQPDDVVNAVPPHWNDGVVEDQGNRWAGQGLTIDSRVTDGAPPRMINGVLVPDLKAFWEARRASHSKEL